jgi:adhesin transport system outer membrane protein
LTGAVTQALEYSPSRAKLIFEADALRSEIAVTRGGILPRVSAQYSYNEITGSRVGIGLRFQAQNGLSQLSAVSSATAKYDQSLDQIRLAERQIRQEIANDIVTYEAATRRAQASRSAASTAQRVSASYMRQFIAGRRSWLDVMNSLRENLSASSGLAQAEVGAMSAATRLYLLSGRWRPTLSNSK